MRGSGGRSDLGEGAAERLSIKQKALDEVDAAVRAGDTGLLSRKYMEGLVVDEAMLGKYSSWDAAKMRAADECGYPFGGGEREILASVIPSGRAVPGRPPERTVGDVCKRSREMYDALRADVSATARDPPELSSLAVGPCWALTIAVPGGDGVKGTPACSALSHSNLVHVSVNVPLCGVCRNIMRSLSRRRGIRT